LQEQYIRYIVARYGAFVDIWEIFNEDSYAPDDYLAHLAKVIRDADPYDHIITTNYERPLAPWCEMVTPHEYMGMPAKDVDAHLGKEFARFKSFGKPVLYTEFGNQGQLSNYDPIKWRIATWTAFMNECGILFWNMSGKKVSGLSRGNANAYLGPESRQYFRVLQEFTKDLPIDMRPVAAGYTEQTDIRTYGLSNGKVPLDRPGHRQDRPRRHPGLHPADLHEAAGPAGPDRSGVPARPAGLKAQVAPCPPIVSSLAAAGKSRPTGDRSATRRGRCADHCQIRGGRDFDWDRQARTEKRHGGEGVGPAPPAGCAC